jgi:hypothetical protein
VATYSTGITATWGGVAFQEITDLQWSYGGGPPKGRSIIWTDDVGSVSLTCLNAANMSIAEYGLRKELVLAGGGQVLTRFAIWESVNVVAELNGLTRFTVTFSLLDQ